MLPAVGSPNACTQLIDDINLLANIIALSEASAQNVKYVSKL